MTALRRLPLLLLLLLLLLTLLLAVSQRAGGARTSAPQRPAADDDDAPSDAAELAADDLFTCEELQANVRLETERAYARGAHKEALVGHIGERTFVIKRPAVNAVSVRNVFNATSSITDYYVHKLHCVAEADADGDGGVRCARRRSAEQFRGEVDDERRTAARLARAAAGDGGDGGGARGPSRFVAAYVGGCLGAARYGEKQLVAQEGPLLGLKNVIGPYRVLRTLPWSARIALAASIFRLLAHLTAAGVAHCSWASHQLGIDTELNVKLLDLGHFVPYRDGRDAPLFSTLPCKRDADCSMTAMHCLRDRDFWLHDRTCDRATGRCAGLTAASWVQFTCHQLEPLLLVTRDAYAEGTLPPSGQPRSAFRREAAAFVAACNATRRDERPTAARAAAQLHRWLHTSGGERHLAAHRADVRRMIAADVAEWVRGGWQRCERIPHC